MKVSVATVLIIMAMHPQISGGQERHEPLLTYEMHTASQAALRGTTPFWHHANTYGRRKAGSRFNSTTDLRVQMPYRSWGPVNVQAGAALSTRLSDASNTAHLSELYAAVRYRAMQLRIGRFRHTMGGNNDALSIGSMIVSRNATPIPKIEFSTPGFFALPLSNGQLQARVYWAEGQLEQSRHVPRARLHQKSVHLKAVGSTFSLLLGVQQNMQWGGDDKTQTWERYRNILFNLRGGGSENTTAAYEAEIGIDLDSWQIQAYRQFYMEDWIGLMLRSPWDGLWGIGAQRSSSSPRWVKGMLYEFMNTIQQDALPGLPEGRAGYYTHHTYRSGWTYEGNSIGNPLIRNPQFRALDNGFQFREDVAGIRPTPSTMVIAHHLGLRGEPTVRTEYEARFTYSRNYGVCQNQIVAGRGACAIGSDNEVPPDLETIPRSELRQDQYATMIDVRYLLSETYGMRLRSSVAVDWGAFDGTQVGLMLGVQWDGTVSL